MVVGPVAGAILGLIVGLILFGVGTPGMWASCLAGGLVGFILGAFWGGLSGLGPVEPENDPLPRMSPEDRDDPPGSGGSSVVG
jgi:hypothetical protein